VDDHRRANDHLVETWVWADLAERLEKAGHSVTVVNQLPSAGTDPSSLADLTADANHVRSVLDKLDEPVVLVGHSYGGMVITELADHPKIRHSVFLAAFWPQRGQSLLSLIGEGADAELDRPPGGRCAEDYRRPRARSRFAVRGPGPRPHPIDARARRVAVGGSIWRTEHGARSGRPTAYMIAALESDNGIPVAAQEAMSANADHVVRLPAAHMVQLSRPYELAEALGRI
jgi:pimeloyl-ACP methyl ester carboxylesterase